MTPNLTTFFGLGWTSVILEEFFRVVCIKVGEDYWKSCSRSRQLNRAITGDNSLWGLQQDLQIKPG